MSNASTTMTTPITDAEALALAAIEYDAGTPAWRASSRDNYVHGRAAELQGRVKMYGGEFGKVPTFDAPERKA